MLLALLFLGGCANEVRVSGVVADAQYGFPLKGAKVRTIVDIVNNEMKMAEGITDRDGRFSLRFETFRTLPNQLAVELSKPGYQSNMYNLRTDSKSDTLLLRRE
jgi:hypothetical protein